MSRPEVAPTTKAPSATSTARQQSLGDLLRRSAMRYPDRTAVVAGHRRMTYAEFDDAANRCANALASRGLVKGDRLALLSHNSWQYAVLTFATARLGVVLVPVNFMLGPDEIAYILTHCGASGLVAEQDLIQTASQALTAAQVTDPIKGVVTTDGRVIPPGWDDVDTWWQLGSTQPPAVVVEDDDPLRLMYTSGTESSPKGVVLSSRSLIAQYVSCAIDGNMTADDVELHALPMYHCAQLDCFFCVDVYLGATSVILSGPDPAAVLATIERERITKLFCPPTVWISLLRHPGFDTTDLSSLRKAYYGASAMPVEVLLELQRRLPSVDLWNLYGQTEMSPLATILRPHEQLTYPGSAGKPALNVETRVVDPEGVPVGAGEIGEIVHRSPQASLGYYRNEAQTDRAFRQGWFHSGDLGTMSEDGYLTVVDRIKDMIKTGGENVASREVEEAIYELAGVAEVAVFGVPHPHWIEAVTAVVVPQSGVQVTSEDIQSYLVTRLAPYKRPKFVVLAESLPKNPSGKILKRELRDVHADLASAAGT